MTKFTKDPSTHPANGPLTEERLIRVRDKLAAAAKRSDGGNLGYMMADAAKAIDEVLAVRKVGQEPVIIVGDDGGDALAYRRLIQSLPAGTKLYAAPQLPQPAVPQRVPESLKLRLITIGDVVEDTNEYCQDIWNACRAAMLQGAEPVQSWIPCSERMPKIGTRVLTCDVERSGVYEAIRFDKNRFNRFGCEIIADYWQPLPAAPQQEVK